MKEALDSRRAKAVLKSRVDMRRAIVCSNIEHDSDWETDTSGVTKSLLATSTIFFLRNKDKRTRIQNAEAGFSRIRGGEVRASFSYEEF